MSHHDYHLLIESILSVGGILLSHDVHNSLIYIGFSGVPAFTKLHFLRIKIARFRPNVVSICLEPKTPKVIV